MRFGPSPRATRLVQKNATGQMLQQCRVERLTAATYDENTLTASPGTAVTVYTGKCRIWEQKSPSMIQISSTDFLAYQTVLSLPWNTPLSQIPRLMDEVEILTSPTDPTWVGARFRIQTLKQGGQILATRSFVLERLSPRP